VPVTENLEALLAALDSPDWAVRAAAARGLARFSDDRGFAGLIRALYDPDDTAVTQAAMEALLEIGSDRAVDALVDALASDEEETADHLYTFLHASHSPVAFEVLRRYERLETQ
jgi:HEAT repeat protein